ncbi:MAG: preprotein translocase subunit YajC [Lachnospiraceae bacterium]|jgi:preprotein translocase subunit YajC|nr:preprotein translocase subunit YajC [Lachnospiraceae bacterium]MCI9681540.1 preprotein translocase subunit YajC [Lachnospiraceae bacterium]
MGINWEVVAWTCITLAVIMGIFGLILSFISAKNMRKRREALGEVHTELKIGSKIMFAGGIYGKVVGIEDETVNVEVAKGTVIQISRYAVQALADS